MNDKRLTKKKHKKKCPPFMRTIVDNKCQLFPRVFPIVTPDPEASPQRAKSGAKLAVLIVTPLSTYPITNATHEYALSYPNILLA